MKFTFEYELENDSGKGDPILTLDVSAEIVGRYRPATQEEPAEERKIEITGIKLGPDDFDAWDSLRDDIQQQAELEAEHYQYGDDVDHGDYLYEQRRDADLETRLRKEEDE